MLAFIVSSVIYPVIAHSGWAPSGFLYQLGYTDFAGECAWAGLLLAAWVPRGSLGGSVGGLVAYSVGALPCH
jgi:ammonia channel protein AmtB